METFEEIDGMFFIFKYDGKELMKCKVQSKLMKKYSEWLKSQGR